MTKSSRKRKFLLGIAALVLVASVFLFQPLLNSLGSALVRADDLEKCDAIVVLAGDYRGERMQTGIELWKRGFGTSLVFWGGQAYWRFSYSDLYIEQLEAAGVPRESAVWSEKELSERSTVGEAREILRLLRERGFRSMILVTSPFHTRRAGWVFDREVGKHGIRVLVHPSGDSVVRLQGWWNDRESAKMIILEYQKLLFEGLRRLVS